MELNSLDLEVPVAPFPTGWQAGLARALKIKVLSAQLAGNRPGVVSLPIRSKAPRVTSFSFDRGAEPARPAENVAPGPARSMPPASSIAGLAVPVAADADQAAARRDPPGRSAVLLPATPVGNVAGRRSARFSLPAVQLSIRRRGVSLSPRGGDSGRRQRWPTQVRPW